MSHCHMLEGRRCVFRIMSVAVFQKKFFRFSYKEITYHPLLPSHTSSSSSSNLLEPTASPKVLMKTLLLQIPVSQSHHSNYKPRFVAYYSKSLTLSWDAVCLSGWLQFFSIPVTHIFCCCRKKLTNIDFYYKHIYFLSMGTS